MQGYGRKILWTDERAVDGDNVIGILRDVWADHCQNMSRCTFLLDYEGGKQPLTRVKTYRSDINIEVADNVANEVTEFKTSFNWGNPITLIQRGDADGGVPGESDGITLLNECYDADGINSKMQELARFVEICGVGHTFVGSNSDYVDGESYFNVNVLDPRFSFVVRSSYYADHRVLLGCSFRADKKGNRYFTCISKDARYEIEQPSAGWGDSGITAVYANPLGRVPFVEWVRSYDRMGCFERQIQEMDNLNILISDFSNDVDQNTQAIWQGNDIEFPTEVTTDSEGNTTESVKYPKTNDWVLTQTTPDGKTPFVSPLAVNYDYSGMLNNIITRRSLILQKCNVPARNDDSGGSTGIAMSQATGLANAEYEATKQDRIKERCKMEEVRLALAVIRESPFVPDGSPLLSLRYSDIKPSIKRQKNFEMTTKINTFATGVSHGISPKWMFDIINLFDDPHQVAEDSAPYMRKYLASAFGTGGTDAGGGAERIEQDESDQIVNSPFVDGMRTKDNSSAAQEG